MCKLSTTSFLGGLRCVGLVTVVSQSMWGFSVHSRGMITLHLPPSNFMNIGVHSLLFCRDQRLRVTSKLAIHQFASPSVIVSSSIYSKDKKLNSLTFLLSTTTK